MRALDLCHNDSAVRATKRQTAMTSEAKHPRDTTETLRSTSDHHDDSVPDQTAGWKRVADSVPEQAVGWRRVAYTALAAIFFVLGITGAIFPLLPATPFLLLTSYFLLRISPKLNRRLLRSKFFGPILSDWQKRGGIRRDVKVQAIVIVCLAVASSIYFSGATPFVVAVTLIAAIIGIGVIIRLPSL